jgi:D-alanine-D-alanine ligase
MKIAVVYNRESKDVINLFGTPNREKIGLQTIKRIADAIRAGGHQVATIEGDKSLIARVGEFIPRVVKGERPGMVFNLSYGIQGQARYTHVPSILEMIGIPYVGSGPLAHSLALDKVVSKMIFQQHGMPTPDFEVMEGPDSPAPKLPYPLIVKPKNEAVSFGIRIVENEQDLREAAQVIFDRFRQPVLVERYIEGREVNVGLLGNDPPEALPPAELGFGEGPAIYTYEDKTRRSGREIKVVCPAPLGEELSKKVQELARRAFSALGCYDCARVDMRLDSEGNVYILEVNSLPSLGEHGSYVEAARESGLDFSGLVNRLIEVASARYFGTPAPARISPGEQDPEDAVSRFVTERRDQIERRVKDLVALSSRTDDRLGLNEVVRNIGHSLGEIGMKSVDGLTDGRSVWTWSSAKGLEDGTLFIGHIDMPLAPEAPRVAFRRDPDWLHGEGIGSSRAPLVMLEYALRALRHLRRLRQQKIGVLVYADETQDRQDSSRTIREAASRASRVFILRPCRSEGEVVVQRRGLRRYRFLVQGKPRRLGQVTLKPDVLRWTCNKIETLASLSSRKDRLSISAVDIRPQRYPFLLPHIVKATILMSYGQARTADKSEQKIPILLGKEDYRWEMEMVSDCPPMPDRPQNRALARELAAVAAKWEFPFGEETSAWPSAAGLVPETAAVLCGLGPHAEQLFTPQEAVHRTSLLQRTLLLALFLARTAG